MSTEIYCFSGTGNSLAVARDIAGRTGARLFSIPSLMENDSISTGSDVIGLVFPVYHKGIPLILKRFVGKLDNVEHKYVFAVYTYGDTPGLGARHLDRLIRARGGQLAAGFGVHMPYNYLTPSFVLKDFHRSFTLREIPLERQRVLFAGAEKKIESIVAYVDARKAGTFEITSDPLTRLADRLGLQETLGKSTWLKVAGVYERTELSFLESRQLMDRGFYFDDKCNACGVCPRICPVDNIRMVDDRPLWRHHCEQCFACLHWCPKEAVQFGSRSSGKRRYHHPGVTLADMLRQSRSVAHDLL